MKKYLFIFKSEIMTSLQYVFNIVTRLISYSLMIFIFINLWKYIYSDPNELINGYSMYQMIWYVIFTEIMWMTLSGRQLTRRISDDVKSGNIAYNIVKPYNYVNYVLASHFGEILIKFLIFVIYGIALGIILVGNFPSINITSAIVIIISALLGMIINSLFSIAIGLVSFVIEDSGPFYWVYSKFLLVLGTLFPIEYFPKVLQKILKYSPIFALSYGPARLFVSFSWDLALIVILVQLGYLVLMYLFTQYIYKKGVKKLNVNGG
jgi:ABC-2 type transport system permease protein